VIGYQRKKHRTSKAGIAQGSDAMSPKRIMCAEG
jgi:hypothetical protein